MAGVRQKRCAPQDCCKRSRFRVTGGKVSVNCKEHAEDGM